MGPILLIVVVLVLLVGGFGGGLGYSGYSRGGYGRGGYYAGGGIGLILVIILIFWLLGGSGHMGRW